MDTEYKYQAFISYRHNQQSVEIARTLHHQIENYGIPGAVKKTLGKKKVGKVFRDQDELPTSADLGGDIEAALVNSEWLIVLCTPELLESKWCMKEVDFFIKLGRRNHILTLLVSGEPDEAFPPQLRFVEIDGKLEEIEPLAADVRADSLKAMKKKLKVEKLRLLAPMLGVGFDDLKQRDRERRLKIIAISSIVSAFILGSFLIYAVRQGQIIATQRNISINNEMLLLIEKSSLATSKGDKTGGMVYALAAYEAGLMIDHENRGLLMNALEYASYIESYEAVTVIKNNNMHISDLTYSNDGTMILGIANGNSAVVIDGYTGEMLYRVSDNKENLNKVQFSSDGKYFLTLCSWENSVTIWNTVNGKKAGKYVNDSATSWMIGSADFLEDSGKVIIKEEDRLVILNVETGKKEYLLEGELAKRVSNYSGLILSSDRKQVAIGSDFGGEVLIVALGDGNRINLENVDKRGYQDLSFSSDGKYLAGISGNLVSCWDANSGKKIFEVIDKDGAIISQVVFKPLSSYLAVAATDGVSLYDVLSNDVIWKVGKGDSNQVYRVVFSNNGKYMLARNLKVALYDAADGSLLSDFGSITVIDGIFHPNGISILMSRENGTFGAFSTPAGSTIEKVQDFREELFFTERYTEFKNEKKDDDSGAGNINLVSEHSTGPNYSQADSRMYTSLDGKYIALSHGDGFIEIWDIKKSAKPLYGIAEHNLPVKDVLFSGEVMASASLDGRVMLFDLSDGLLSHVVSFGTSVQRVEFSADGRRLIVYSEAENCAYVLSVESGAILFKLSGGEMKIKDIGFTLDGKKAVALLEDGSAIIGRLYPKLNDLLEHAKNIVAR